MTKATIILDLKEKHYCFFTNLMAKYADYNLTFLTLTNNFPKKVINPTKYNWFFLTDVIPKVNQILATKPLQIIQQHQIYDQLGLSVYWVIQGCNPTTLKSSLLKLEQAFPRFKYADLDVYQQAHKITRSVIGYGAKPCFACQMPAKYCHQTQTHTLSKLQTIIENDFRNVPR